MDGPATTARRENGELLVMGCVCVSLIDGHVIGCPASVEETLYRNDHAGIKKEK
jgi:hypothetical protein